MKNYKIYFLLIFLLGIGIISFAGKDKEAAKVENSAYQYLQAVNSGNYEKAKQYATEDTKKFLDMIGTFSGMIPDSVKQIKAAEVVEIQNITIIEGSKAVVSYTSGGQGDQTLQLQKVGNKWLVVQDKESASLAEKVNETPVPEDYEMQRDEEAAEKAASIYLNAFSQMDYEKAKKVSTVKTKEFLDMLQSLSSIVPDSVIKKTANEKISIISSTIIDGKKAIVNYKSSVKDGELQLNLIKDNDQWLVQQSKDPSPDGDK